MSFVLLGDKSLVLCLQRASEKAERDSGGAFSGPLGGHFSHSGAASHSFLLLLELTGLPWELQSAKWLLCKQLSDGVGLSLNPELALPPLCLDKFEGT